MKKEERRKLKKFDQAYVKYGLFIVLGEGLARVARHGS